MTNKELQKLGRRELLQLLLEQAKEAERLGKMLKENDQQLKQLEESYERLRDRLDKKDEQLRELKNALQAERDKREAELTQALRAGIPVRPGAQYPPAAQGYAPPPERPAPGSAGVQPGFPGGESRPYEPPAPDPYQTQAAPDPFPYQVPPQPPGAAYRAGAQQADPFPYRPLYQGAPQPDVYAPGMEAPYQYPPPRPERKRQGGQHGKMPFRLKREENGKTTLFFGWQHD